MMSIKSAGGAKRQEQTVYTIYVEEVGEVILKLNHPFSILLLSAISRAIFPTMDLSRQKNGRKNFLIRHLNFLRGEDTN